MPSTYFSAVNHQLPQKTTLRKNIHAVMKELTFQRTIANVVPSKVECINPCCTLNFRNDRCKGTERCPLNIGGLEQVDGTHANKNSIFCDLKGTVNHVRTILNCILVGKISTIRIVSTGTIMRNN